MSVLTPVRREGLIFGGLFAVALVFHFSSATFNWHVPFLAGHEFRQAQTALITDYIDRQNNFSLLYETPIMGKPWVSILLEVPLYQWGVVGLSRATGWPHHEAARAISLVSFYLTLPAIFLLLGRLGLPPVRRLLPLALILSCPVYIYYARAFLIDATATMASAWFLAAFFRTMDQRHVGWLALASVAGTIAALIKSAIFAVWLLPGAAYGAWLLWCDWRTGRGWAAVLRTTVWGLATVAVPLGALRWWLALTDPIKEAHASAHIFTSTKLSQGNWGLFDVSSLFTAELWCTMAARWGEAIMPAAALAGAVGASLALARRGAGPGFLVVAFFWAPQLLFPFAYAYQDYYFYSCAIFLHGGLGLWLLAGGRGRWSGAMAALVAAGIMVVQGHTYWRGYRLEQSVVKEAGASFTDVIRDGTPPESVIVVAGADWGAMIPYYAERRALMIRNGLEYDPAYLRRAFGELEGETIAAFVVQGKVRQNHDFVQQVAEWFDLETRPTLVHADADVYVAKRFASTVRAFAELTERYPGLAVAGTDSAEAEVPLIPVEPALAQNEFAMIAPAPFQARFQFGFNLSHMEQGTVLSAHPDADVWLRLERASRSITWEFGLFDGAYNQSEGGSNGVEFVISRELPDGGRQGIFRKLLDPAALARDRGLQRVTIPHHGEPGDVVRFSTRANGNKAFDWAYWKSITVE